MSLDEYGIIPEQDIAQADELTRLRAEVEALRDSNAAKADRIDRLGKTVVRLRAENDALKNLLRRYRNETPIGFQPYMIAHEVDDALAKEPT